MRLVIVRTNPNFRMWDVVAPQARGTVIGHVHAVIPNGYEASDRKRNPLGWFPLRRDAIAAVEASLAPREATASPARCPNCGFTDGRRLDLATMTRCDDEWHDAEATASPKKEA